MARRPHPMYSNACAYCGAPEGQPCDPARHDRTDPEANPDRIAYHLIGCDCAACVALRGPRADLVPYEPAGTPAFRIVTPAPALDLRAALASMLKEV